MGVADLLASVGQPPASKEEAPKAPAADEGEPAADGGESTEDVPAEEEGEEAPEPEIDLDAKAKSMQADYTRKTQALADERKKLHADIAAEREEWAKKEEDFEEVVEWLQGLHDPEKTEYNLMRYFPDAMQALKEKWIAESGEEAQMTERERAAVARAKRLEVEARARKEDEDRAAARWKKQQQAQKSAEWKAAFEARLPAAAKAAGLDQDDDTYRLIRNELIGGKEYANKKWSEDVILAAAKAVAKAMKRGEPPKTEEPKLPPSPKPQGHKAPPGSKALKTKPKQDTGDFFAKLREKYGAE